MLTYACLFEGFYAGLVASICVARPALCETTIDLAAALMVGITGLVNGTGSGLRYSSNVRGYFGWRVVDGDSSGVGRWGFVMVEATRNARWGDCLRLYVHA